MEMPEIQMGGGIYVAELTFDLHFCFGFQVDFFFRFQVKTNSPSEQKLERKQRIKF